jgi:uncharacterized membrane protein YdjX (TVP38/TMEM64 family)
MPDREENRPAEAGVGPESPSGAWWQSKSWRWGLGILALVVVGLLVWAYMSRGYLWARGNHFFDLILDKERVQAVLKAAGPLAPMVFVLLQALQVVLAPIPGEATGFIGGYLFGVPLGLLYSIIGLTIGSAAAFLIARWLEEHCVVRWIPAEVLQKFDFLMERQGALIAFMLFLLPGFPKDYLCFLLGLSHMPLKLFLLICIVGRVPGTLMLAMQGAKVYQGDYYSTAVILGLCLVVMGVLWYYREPLYKWIRRFDHPEDQSPGRP